MNGYRPLVLMVEDNADTLHINAKWLAEAGYDTVNVRTLNDARKILEERSPDIVILDIMLPDGDGLVFLPELKALCEAPVLLCSSRGEDKDIIRGLEAGGDYYIPKPYNVDVLVAHVGVMWRAERENHEKMRTALSAKTLKQEIVCGALKLDLLSGHAFMNGIDAGLTPKEFALLYILMQNVGREISTKTLYVAVWGLPANGDTRRVKDHVSKLRRKLAINEFTPLTITAEYGKGYRLDWQENSTIMTTF